MTTSTTTLWPKCHYAKCFGNWAVSNVECSKCAISSNCEKRTKSRLEEDKLTEDIPEDTEEQEVVMTSFEYLLKSLSGKFDHEEGSKGDVVIHYFKKDGAVVFIVALGKSGRIKVINHIKGVFKIIENSENTGEAEAALASIL